MRSSTASGHSIPQTIRQRWVSARATKYIHHLFCSRWPDAAWTRPETVSRISLVISECSSCFHRSHSKKNNPIWPVLYAGLRDCSPGVNSYFETVLGGQTSKLQLSSRTSYLRESACRVSRRSTMLTKGVDSPFFP